MEHVLADVSAKALSQMIGRYVRYQGVLYRVADALPDEGILMLVSEEDGDTSVQDDSYGRAHRITPRSLRLRVRAATGEPTEQWKELQWMPESNRSKP